MTTTTEDCVIWNVPIEATQLSTGGFRTESLRTDGAYIWEGGHGSGELSDIDRAKITTWLIDQRQLGSDAPLLTQKIIEQCKVAKPLPVHERADRLLRLFVRETPRIGESVFVISFANEDGSADSSFLAWSESVQNEELQFLIECLVKKNWLVRMSDSIAAGGNYQVTIDGYARISEIDTSETKSEQAFVAMWFDASMSAAFEQGINPAIRAAGYNSLRIDRTDHNNKIDDEIIAEIRRSRFVVADFTGGRGGVYYEAGFARGLRLDVISTCRQDALKDLHFDTRQYNHIVWDTTEDLRKQLFQRIGATVGDGPLKPDS